MSLFTLGCLVCWCIIVHSKFCMCFYASVGFLLMTFEISKHVANPISQKEPRGLDSNSLLLKRGNLAWRGVRFVYCPITFQCLKPGLPTKIFQHCKVASWLEGCPAVSTDTSNRGGDECTPLCHSLYPAQWPSVMTWRALWLKLTSLTSSYYSRAVWYTALFY